ncbi:polysaccharide biosynthesis/export family protein [Flavobacterium sp. ACAM 123]|uniref:polysaccharide biosynthesis/export family protein n=1 Tax=Flavobacterium sp. ACAM 123 TaxID=1189620 RepID=UPI0021019018|nr:polysaccharide biosynthesis/export family protein [Flavobacterium sp. ACAM 123]
MGFVLTFTIFGSLFNIAAYYHLLGAVLVLFFLGLKDDILVLSAKSKFIVQLIVSLLLVLSSNLTISSLYGVFGIYEIGSLSAIAITTFVFVLIINSYNLIDGIDGLAGTIALCFLTVSSVLFYNSNSITLCVISIILMGSVMAFLQYNFSIKKKIFMGDTGSMIVGFLISFLLVNILNLKELNLVFFSYQTNPVLLIALLFYPLLDTARIFFVRLIILKKSPFSADKNHIHHKLLSLGFKHYQISLFVGVATLILAFLSLLIVNETIYFQLFSIIFIGILLFFTPVILHKMKSFKFNFLKDGILLFLILLSMGVMQSCASKKDVLYFQDGTDANIINTRIGDQKIESNDILAVKIYSIDPEVSKIYNIDLLEGSVGVSNLETMKLKGYLVSDEGSIIMPVLGKVVVNDKTTAMLEAFLKEKLIVEGHLKEPIVSVRILNSKITILGEVRSPGTFTFVEKNLTLLQALGLAGDLTISGKRQDVLLIRNENNRKTIYHLDLTSRDWMSTDLYYIKQNDVIVVNPNNAKIKSSGIIGNPGTLIAIISFLLTGFLLIKN